VRGCQVAGVSGQGLGDQASSEDGVSGGLHFWDSVREPEGGGCVAGRVRERGPKAGPIGGLYAALEAPLFHVTAQVRTWGLNPGYPIYEVPILESFGIRYSPRFSAL
jgi:hypothetical protein